MFSWDPLDLLERTELPVNLGPGAPRDSLDLMEPPAVPGQKGRREQEGLMAQSVKRVTPATEAHQVAQGKMDKLALLGSWDPQGLLGPQGPQALSVQWNLNLSILKALEPSGHGMNPESQDQMLQMVSKEKKETQGSRVKEGWMAPALWDLLDLGDHQGASRSCLVL